MTAFVVTGSDLLDAASWVSRIVPAKPPVPLLGGLLLEAGDQLTVTGFDFDTCGTATVPATVKEPGRALLSARLLVNVAKTLGRDVDVAFEIDNGHAQVRCGRSEWTVPGMPADQYPQLPAGSEPLGTVDAEVLRRALSRVLPAAAQEEAVSNLCGVRIEPSPGGLTVVATDRYRLAAADVPLGGDVEFPDCLVPAELLDAAMRTTGGGSDIHLSATDHTFGIRTDRHVLVGRQIAEEYPRWRGMVPEPTDHSALVNVAGLTRAISQAQVMSANDEAPILVDFADGAAAVAAEDGDRRARAEVELDAMDGESIAIKVKASFLRAALATMEADVARVHFHKRMIVLRPSGADGAELPGYLHLVMYRAGERR